MTDEKPKALPTNHVDYFVVDPSDVDVFEHAAERVTTELLPARTMAEVRNAIRSREQ